MKNLLIALVVLAAAGCSEPMQKGIETNEDIYNVTTSWDGTLENTAHSLPLSFQATSSWEATVQDEAKTWLSVTPTSGASGLNKVLVNVRSNPTAEDRAGSLSIVPLIGEPYVVTVSQKKGYEAEEQDYTSFVLEYSATPTLPNCVIGYFDSDGYCWEIVNFGTLSTGFISDEIIIFDDSISELYFFSDYVGCIRADIVFELEKKKRNTIVMPSGVAGISVDKTNPKEYPQKKTTD